MKILNFILTTLIWYLPIMFVIHFLKPIYEKAGLIPLQFDTSIGILTLFLFLIIFVYSIIVASKFHDWFKSNIK